MECNLVEAGEKMGLQITVLLADIIYVEVLQSTVPVFDSLGTFDFFSFFNKKPICNISNVSRELTINFNIFHRINCLALWLSIDNNAHIIPLPLLCQRF